MQQPQRQPPQIHQPQRQPPQMCVPVRKRGRPVTVPIVTQYARIPIPDCEYIVKGWAMEIQNLKSEDKLFAKKAIYDILFEAQMCRLDKDSVVINKPTTETSNYPAQPPVVVVPENRCVPQNQLLVERPPGIGTAESTTPYINQPPLMIVPDKQAPQYSFIQERPPLVDPLRTAGTTTSYPSQPPLVIVSDNRPPPTQFFVQERPPVVLDPLRTAESTPSHPAQPPFAIVPDNPGPPTQFFVQERRPPVVDPLGTAGTEKECYILNYGTIMVPADNYQEFIH